MDQVAFQEQAKDSLEQEQVVNFAVVLTFSPTTSLSQLANPSSNACSQYCGLTPIYNIRQGSRAQARVVGTEHASEQAVGTQESTCSLYRLFGICPVHHGSNVGLQ